MAMVDNTVLDAALDIIATAVTITPTVTEPANFAGISGATPLGTYTVTGADFTNADGATGRKVTLSAQSGENGTDTGAANYLCYDDGATLLFTTAASGDTINSGSPFTIGSYIIVTFADPT